MVSSVCRSTDMTRDSVAAVSVDFVGFGDPTFDFEPFFTFY